MKVSHIIGIVLFFFMAGMVSCKETVKQSFKEPSALKVKKNVFINDSGKIVRLCGVSFSDPDKLKKENQWNLRYFEEARRWGCNVIRLPIHPYTWRYRGIEDYLKILDQGVEWARQTNMYVIIDWHAIGNLPENVYPHFNYATNWAETINFWKIIAEHYKGNSTVAFYELFNEPCDQGKPLSWDAWQPLMEQLIDSINMIDDQKVYLVAGMNWAYLLDEVVQKPVDRNNVAYVTHPYPQKVDAPWEDKWERNWGHVADHYPVVATEMGYVVKGQRGEHIPCIGDEKYGEAIINYLDKKGISYTVWCFDPSWAPALLDDFDFNLTRQGEFFKRKLQMK